MSSTYQTVAAVGLFSSGLAAGSSPFSLVDLVCITDLRSTLFLTPSFSPGLTLSYPLLINPHFRSTEGGIPIKHRLQIWNKSYDFGVGCIPFVALGSTLAFFATAWLVPDAPVAFQRSAVLSGVLHISIVPFTVRCLLLSWGASSLKSSMG